LKIGETRNFSGHAKYFGLFRFPHYDSKMNSLHLTADLSDCHCEAAWLVDEQRLGAACLQAVNNAGLQAVAQLFHRFPDSPQGPGGITATVLLAESHLCVHTWPETRSVTLDVYVCNFGGDHSEKARTLMASLMQLFAPGKAAVNALERGAA
jgi:S-adenosylmethionine decarboxylase